MDSLMLLDGKFMGKCIIRGVSFGSCEWSRQNSFVLARLVLLL